MWAKFDEKTPHHPKIMRAGTRAAWMWFASICYANEHKTNGFIPAGGIRWLTDERNPADLAEKLVIAGLWEPTDGGWFVHDYAVYQPSSEERVNLSNARAEAGRRGGISSGKVRAARSKRATKTPTKPASKTETIRNPVTDPDPGSEKPDTERSGDPSPGEPAQGALPGFGAAQPSKQPAKKPTRPGWNELVALYSDQWAKQRSADGATRPAIGGPDVDALRRVYDDNGETEAAVLVRRFIADDDRWIAGRGWQLRDLPNRINAYRARADPATHRSTGPAPVSDWGGPEYPIEPRDKA